MTISNEQIQALQALYANIEKQAHTLRGNPREYSVITGLCPVNAIEMLAQKIQALLSEKEADKAPIAELQGIRAAAEKLVRCKGRYHSEQNYRALAALFGVNTPELPPLDNEARTLTVKLPDGEEREDLVLSINEEIAHLNRCVERYRKEEMASTTQEMEQRLLVQQIALSVLTSAAGITLKVGGE